MSPWLDGRKWPRPLQDHMFVLEAIRAFGAAKFGKRWRGREMMAEYPPVALPIFATAMQFYDSELLAREERAWQARKAAVLAEAPMSNLQRWKALYFPSRAQIDSQAADLAVVMRENRLAAREKGKATFKRDVKKITEQANWARITRAIKRRERAEQAFASCCANGQIETVIRPVLGGAYKVLDPSTWDAERLERRFRTGRINLDDAFSDDLSDNCSGYIFVKTATFEPVVRKLLRKHDTQVTTIISKAAAVKECTSWLIEQFKADTVGSMRKAALSNAAKERFSGRLSGKGFETAWSAAAEEFPERRAGGRRRDDHRAESQS